MRRLVIILWLCLLPFAGWSQDATDDRDFLTAFLEDNLSGLGRKVTIEGFQGALSSRATFSLLTVADADGVWITIRDGAISWNRTALLAGRVEVEELSAVEIDLPRAPHRESAGGDAEATDLTQFSLPELPVSISIGALTTERLILGAALLGQEAVVTIAAKAELADGAGSTDFSMRRVDGREGELVLKAAFANNTREATIDLLATEAADGIAATLLDLPGRPSAKFALHGSGSIDDFETDMALATDGSPRLTGTLRLAGQKDDAVETVRDRKFVLHLEGDIAPLLQPDYRTFFGSAVSLDAEGVRHSSGRTDLTRLVLDSDGLDISGRLGLSPENIPLAAVLTMRFGVAGQDEILLPVPGQPTFVKNGTVFLRYDAERGSEWDLSGDLEGFRRADLRVATLLIDGKGHILHSGKAAGSSARIAGKVSFDASGIALADPALNAALGDNVAGETVFSWQDGKPLMLRNTKARAGGVDLIGNFAISNQGLDLVVSGDARATAADIERFSALAGRKLGGAISIVLDGRAAVLSRSFDVQGRADGRGLSVDQPHLDRLLAKGSKIDFSVKRNKKGITLREFDLNVAELRADVTGVLLNDRHDLSAELEFRDLGALGNGFAGSLRADARLSGPIGQRHFTLDGNADGLGIGSASVDSILRGQSHIAVDAVEEGGQFALTALQISNPQFDASAAGADGGGAYTLTARLRNMEILAPGFPGELGIAGRVAQTAAGYDLALNGSGPGQTSATAAGSVAADFSQVDVVISGNSQSAVLNNILAPRSVDGPVRFDLQMKGPPGLASLSGKVSADTLKVASPEERLSVEKGSISAELSGGRAELTGSASLRGGGRLDLSGPVDLTPPYNGALVVELFRARLHDPNLFETQLSGRVTIDGPLLGGAVVGGAITLHESEISVAPASFEGGAVLPITHVNTSAKAAQTLSRSGLNRAKNGRANGQGIYGLDLEISAPARLFVRGRGLDAELSGNLRLRGTTDDVQPSGQFNLIRGRFDLLGKRFVLDEGLVQLLGSFVPYLNFSASADTFGSTATVVLEGLASSPRVHFTSSSGLPEEEVISQLLFGNGLDNISAFQLAQLATAVATLTGRGGEGIVVRLRKNFKLDDLDITADEDGDAALKAGKYLSDKVYSEASVGADGKSQIDLNLDLNSDVTLRGTLGTDGSTGIGVFFNKDY